MWYVRRGLGVMAIGASRGVLIATQLKSAGPTSFYRGIWGIHPATGSVLWTRHDARGRLVGQSWWARAKSLFAFRWDAPLAVHDGAVLCASGRVLAVRTGEDLLRKADPELQRMATGRPGKNRVLWLDRDIAGPAAIILPDPSWMEATGAWLAKNGIDSRSPQPSVAGGASTVLPPCMDIEGDWRDASGRVLRSGQSFVVGPLGLRVVPSPSGVWSPTTRCTLEIVHLLRCKILARRTLRTPSGDMQVRMIPHALGVLVLTSSGSGRRQMLGAEWRRWNWT